jgi:hypothetical protein
MRTQISALLVVTLLLIAPARAQPELPNAWVDQVIAVAMKEGKHRTRDVDIDRSAVDTMLAVPPRPQVVSVPVVVRASNSSNAVIAAPGTPVLQR